jgi:hypothetical protein
MFTVLLCFIPLAIFGQDKKPDPATPPPPQAAQIQLTPLGKLAFKTVAQEIQQVQADINELQAAEIKAQGLKPGEWQLNIYAGTLVHVQGPPLPPGPPIPPPAPTPSPLPAKPTAAKTPKK